MASDSEYAHARGELVPCWLVSEQMKFSQSTEALIYFSGTAFLQPHLGAAAGAVAGLPNSYSLRVLTTSFEADFIVSS